MISIHFKDVGQGDSIVLEWNKGDEPRLGIIDCHAYKGHNPVLEHVQQKQIKEIEFIVLSHLHYDHFSGMAELFDYFIIHKIKVKIFYHTLNGLLGELYNRIFTSQKIQAEMIRFITAYEKFDALVEDKVVVTPHVQKLELADNTFLSFLAPKGNLYDIMAKQLSRKVNRITTANADVNKLSTIILIENPKNCILLTSDAVKKSFSPLRLDKEVTLVQAPHHGSWLNVQPKFWQTLKTNAKCPAIFSVGDEPKDKLPNKETVAFFDKMRYDVYSTNSVYGIADHFNLGQNKLLKTPVNIALNPFSTLRKRYSTGIASSKFDGDRTFQIL